MLTNVSVEAADNQSIEGAHKASLDIFKGNSALATHVMLTIGMSAAINKKTMEEIVAGGKQNFITEWTARTAIYLALTRLDIPEQKVAQLFNVSVAYVREAYRKVDKTPKAYEVDKLSHILQWLWDMSDANIIHEHFLTKRYAALMKHITSTLSQCE